MEQPHFKELGMNSFFGDMIYQRIVTRDHFLVKLNRLIDREAFVPILLPTKAQDKKDVPPNSPSVILKMLVMM